MSALPDSLYFAVDSVSPWPAIRVRVIGGEPTPWWQVWRDGAVAFLAHHGIEAFVLLVLAVAIVYALCLLARPDEHIEHPEEA